MIIVYRTENKVNGRFYYGLHTADDKYYLGSGYRLKKAIKKYGKENFIRRTVREFDTVEAAREFEKLVIEAVINNPACYNVNNGGTGVVKGNIPWNKGKKCPGVGGRKPGFKHTDDWKSKMVESVKKSTKTMYLDTQTGVFYYNIQEAADALNIKHGTLKAMLSGQNPNKTSLIRSKDR